MKTNLWNFEHTITTVVKIRMEHKDGVLAVKFNKGGSFLTSLKELKAALKAVGTTVSKASSKQMAKALGGVNHYFYAEGVLFERLCKALGRGVEHFKEVYALESQNAFDLLHRADFDPSKLLREEHETGMFYPLDSNMPWSKPYRVGYIGGVTNEHFNLFEAEKILLRNKWVSDVEPISIPYYNQRENNTKAIEFTVQVSQDEHDRLVRYMRKRDKAYWTCHVSGAFSSAFVFYKYAPDPLGLRKARHIQQLYLKEK